MSLIARLREKYSTEVATVATVATHQQEEDATVATVAVATGVHEKTEDATVATVAGVADTPIKYLGNNNSNNSKEAEGKAQHSGISCTPVATATGATHGVQRTSKAQHSGISCTPVATATGATHEAAGGVIEDALPEPDAAEPAYEVWTVRHALGEVRVIQQPAVTEEELRRRYPGVIAAWPWL